MIRAIITDFDGTLADTFEANYAAYRQAFDSCSGDVGSRLTRDSYRNCFGLRFDAFMDHMGIDDAATRERIRQEKCRAYPSCFDRLVPNQALTVLIEKAHMAGIGTAIASTARKENLMNALSHLGLASMFDIIVAGEDVKEGKPNPEIYETAMARLGVSPDETLIFEDSETGLLAAERSGAAFMKITQEYFC